MDIKYWFPHGSTDFYNANSNNFTSHSYTQPGVCDGILEKGKTKKSHPSKCMVSITSYRVRLADVDALCGKWHLDALRYAGAIKDDTPEAITYQITQKKVKKKTEEKTVINITYPNVCQT